MSEKKYILSGINGKLDVEEEKISELELIAIESIKDEI